MLSKREWYVVDCSGASGSGSVIIGGGRRPDDSYALGVYRLERSNGSILVCYLGEDAGNDGTNELVCKIEGRSRVRKEAEAVLTNAGIFENRPIQIGPNLEKILKQPVGAAENQKPL